MQVLVTEPSEAPGLGFDAPLGVWLAAGVGCAAVCATLEAGTPWLEGAGVGAPLGGAEASWAFATELMPMARSQSRRLPSWRLKVRSDATSDVPSARDVRRDRAVA